MTIAILLLLLLAIVLAPWLGADSRRLDASDRSHTYPALPDRSAPSARPDHLTLPVDARATRNRG